MRYRRTKVLTGNNKIYVIAGSIIDTRSSNNKIIRLLRAYGASEKEITNFMNDLEKGEKKVSYEN